MEKFARSVVERRFVVGHQGLEARFKTPFAKRKELFNSRKPAIAFELITGIEARKCFKGLFECVCLACGICVAECAPIEFDRYDDVVRIAIAQAIHADLID